MTDASHPITVSALESLADLYLSTIEADVRKEDSVWEVTLPEWTDIGFCDEQHFELHFSELQGLPAQSEGAYELTPGSSFTQSFLESIGTIQPTGSITLTEDTVGEDHRVPEWFHPSNGDIVDTSFYPYYDRKAILSFVQVSVETVSDYETGFLRAVAVDISSGEVLVDLPETVLALAFQPDSTTSVQRSTEGVTNGGVDEGSAVESSLSRCQEVSVEQVESELTDIRSRATRAAHEEFEQYRQLQQQRLQDTQSELNSIDSRLSSVGQKVDQAETRQARMDALQKRKDLTAEKEKLSEEREAILEKQSRGFQQKKRDIFERHSIEVRTTNVCSTLVAYERGELEIVFDITGSPSSLRVPYAVGEGMTDSVRCPQCGSEYSRDNRVKLPNGNIMCEECS